MIGFVPPTGQALDDRWGDPTRLTVSATPTSLLAEGSGTAPGLRRGLRFADGPREGVLHVSVQAAACDAHGDDGEVPEGAACHLYQQDWGIPVRLVEGAASEPGARPARHLTAPETARGAGAQCAGPSWHPEVRSVRACRGRRTRGAPRRRRRRRGRRGVVAARRSAPSSRDR
ncbi:hypothetical protein GCM10025868_24650 [Angustibacter aerolatus]|uniref:Uncharacterized protein n=1 Tax=Angustibacter aerolatus TaxID=1162965 RepID=A0ABQ6JJ01_9ACTN|nr:hypothetical protein GCM10025868_24650 [Angustibacter aerolatus]